MDTIFSLDTYILPRVRLLCHVDYKKPWIHFTRSSDEFILYYIISGELFIREGTTEYTLTKGDYLILEPNIIHTGFKSSCCHYFYVHFKDEGLSRLDNIADEDLVGKMMESRKESLQRDIYLDYQDAYIECFLPKYYNIGHDDQFLQMFYRANADFHTKTEHYKSSAACQLLDILIRIGRLFTSDQIAKDKSPWPKAYAKVNEIKNFLIDRHKQKITSSIIEEEFELSYDYLNKVFHKLTGYSIFNYLNLVRISKAKELIEVSNMKYSEIADSVGIEDQFYFSKMFKKYTGMSPSQYWHRYNILSNQPDMPAKPE